MTNQARTALVTGANKGLGKEIARRLAATGMTVALGARDENRGRAAAAEVGGRFVRLDVTDPASVDAAMEAVGDLDVLVNNAGVAVEWGVEPEEIGADEVRRTYEVNVFGVVTVTRAAIPRLRPGARVVNMSSPLGSLALMSDPDSPEHFHRLLAYNSSKAALNALTIMYANLLRPKGILVNAVSPGLVGTDLNGYRPGANGVRTVEEGAQVPVRAALFGPDGPTGRFLADDGPAVDGRIPW